MSGYQISDKNRYKYKNLVLSFIGDILHKSPDVDGYDIIMDMSDMPGINAYTLGLILEEELEYECVDRDRNGWQMDFWIHYRAKVSSKLRPGLCITGTGITGEFCLRGEEDDYMSPQEKDELLANDPEFQELMQRGMQIIEQTEKLLKEMDENLDED